MGTEAERESLRKNQNHAGERRWKHTGVSFGGRALIQLVQDPGLHLRYCKGGGGGGMYDTKWGTLAHHVITTLSRTSSGHMEK